jgi:glycerol-3-phosphate dehydrogenase
VTRLLRDPTGKVSGAVVHDTVTDETFHITADSVLFCGGPFTDELRKLEDPDCTSAVDGASGIHIVMPGYYAPRGVGMVDMNTSDGRFLFFLPWEDHVVVGTTDHRAKPSMRPIPAEDEIKWLLNETSKVCRTTIHHHHYYHYHDNLDL